MYLFRSFKNLPLLCVLFALPAALARPGHVFVFQREAPTAVVYDAGALTRVASPAVGRHASHAFAVAGREGGGTKYYVVSEGAVVVLNSDFTVRGTVFLPGGARGPANAAALTRDATRLLVAAGRQLHVVETVNDSLVTSIDLDFTATGVAISGDSRRAYLTSAQSRWVRIVDLERFELADAGLELPELPGTITASEDGSRVYVTGRGAIYALDQSIDGFLKPVIAANSSELSLQSTDPENSQAKSANRPAEPFVLNESPLIERLTVGADRSFVMFAGGRLLRGDLGPGGTLNEMPAGPLNERAADVATSPDGRTLFAVTRAEPRLIRFDVSNPAQFEEITLASEPAALAVAPEPVAQSGELDKFSGDGQIVASDTPFSLIARAVDDDGDPQQGVVVTVFATTPNFASCSSPLFPTDANGLAMISCTAATVGAPTPVAVIISDNLGRAPTPPFEVTIVPSSVRREGLHKLLGDGQVVDENSDFPAALEVIDFVDEVAQDGKVLTISTSPSGFVSCFAMGSTNSNGRGVINCDALSVSQTRVVQIDVTDSDGRSLVHPFSAVVKDSEASISGLSKVDGDNQTVVRNNPFPEPLVVLDRMAGEPVDNATLTVTETPSSAVSCENSVVTNSSGLAEIDCEARDVNATTNVQVAVMDEFGQSLPQPFNATILAGSPSDEGLSKVSGDDQLVAQGMSLGAPLVVSAVSEGQPQANLLLTVTSSNQIVLFCPGSDFTNSSGIASFSCSAGTVASPTTVNVTVRDPQNRFVIFTVTVVPTNPADVENLVLLSDDFLEVEVGETIDDGVQVRAIDDEGGPVAGVWVFFSSNQDVSFSPAVGITGLDGETEISPTFGCFTGLGRIRIGLEPDGNVESVRFRAFPGSPTLLTKTQGDNQVGRPGERLDEAALVVRVTDVCENPIRGERVTWTVNPPEAATLQNVISTTDANGRSSAVVLLGNRPGPFTVTARTGDLTATFDLTVNVIATQIQLISGNNQSVALGQIAPLPLVIEVQDDDDRPVPGVQVVFAVTQGSATLTSDPTVTTDSVGRAQAFVRVGDALGTIEVVATAVGQTVSFTITTIGRVPVVSSVGFVNGASFRPGWVPGSTGTIFGVGLMEGVTGVVQPGVVPFPTILLGVRVIVNGVDAPILSLANVDGQEQINIQVPFGLSAPGVATVTIRNNGSEATVGGIPLFSVQPGIFEITAEGARIVAALHTDFSLVTPSNPARPGQIILLFLTGLGRTIPPVGTNVLGPVPPAVSVVNPVVGIDDGGVEVLGSFYAPGLVTVFQINFVVSADIPPGMRKLSIVAGGTPSQDSVIPVGPPL